MPQEQVEIVRRAFEAFNRTFREGAPDLYELIDPEVEWVPMSALVEGTCYHGHDGVRQWLEEMKRDWTSYETRPERFLDLGDDRVLALGRWRAQGRGGDVLLDFPQAAWLVQVRDGSVVLVRTFTDRNKAFEVAGHFESTTSHENVEVVRRGIAAYNRRDFEAIRALNHPDVQLDWSASRGPEAGVYQGLEQVLGFYQSFLGTWEEVDMQPDDFIESGDSVVVPNTAHLRGRDGIETVARSTLIFELRRGRVARIRLYQETREALEALGQRE